MTNSTTRWTMRTTTRTWGGGQTPMGWTCQWHGPSSRWVSSWLCAWALSLLVLKRDPLSSYIFANSHAWTLLDFPVLFFCPFLPVFVAYPVWWVQEYTEEFREIAPRSKKNLGGVADGNITLINQRSVCDDLPVCTPTYLHPPLIDASQNLTMCTIFICLFSLFYKSV